MEVKVTLETIIFYVQDINRLKSFDQDVFDLKIIEEYQSVWALLDAGSGDEGNQNFDNYDYWLCDGEDPEGNVFQLKQRK